MSRALLRKFWHRCILVHSICMELSLRLMIKPFFSLLVLAIWGCLSERSWLWCLDAIQNGTASTCQILPSLESNTESFTVVWTRFHVTFDLFCLGWFCGRSCIFSFLQFGWTLSFLSVLHLLVYWRLVLRLLLVWFRVTNDRLGWN